jgi:hypothetical protein
MEVVVGHSESTLANFVLTHDEILRYVKTAGENDYVDAKAPCSWDDEATKASLAKDIAAFSNSEGGGAIVIGRAETTTGHFDFSGLTSEQCKSFDTTKVAQWVNNHFSPSIRLTCCPAEFDSKSFVVIAVAEFSDRPTICTKDRQSNGKALITKGTLYVRNENAESAPLMTPDQVSRLIGRAVVKQQESLRQVFDSVLAGRTAKSVPTDEEQFSAQANLVEKDLLDGGQDHGAWKFTIHPDTFVERWESPKKLKEVIWESRIASRRFPQEYPEPIPRSWGVSGNYNVWALTHHGMFYFWKNYYEDREPWKSQDVFAEKNQDLPVGQWLNFIWSVYMVGDFFAFAKRYSDSFGASSQMRYMVLASKLKRRHLVLQPGGAELRDLRFAPCAVETFSHRKTVPAGQIASAWKDLFTDCLVGLYHSFPGGSEMIHRESIERWVERYAAEAGL